MTKRQLTLKLAHFRSRRMRISAMSCGALCALFGALLVLNFVISTISDGRAGFFVMPSYQQGNVYRVVQQEPLDQPLFSEQEILDFVTEISYECMTLSFDDYDSRMQRCEQIWFTKSGWIAYTQALKKSGLFAKIFRNFEVNSFIPTRAPFIEFAAPVDYKLTPAELAEAGPESPDTLQYYVWRIKVYGAFHTTSLAGTTKPRELPIELTFDLQRVPRGKGAAAIKVISVSPIKTITQRFGNGA